MQLEAIEWIDRGGITKLGMIDIPSGGVLLVIQSNLEGTYDMYEQATRKSAAYAMVISRLSDGGDTKGTGRVWKRLNALEAQCVLYEVLG